MAPFLAAYLFALRSHHVELSGPLDRLLRIVVDRAAALLIEPCDIFIGMSGLAIASAESVRKKYGAKVWIERGSTHIRTQADIFNRMRSMGLPTAKIAELDIKRELSSYECADVIVVPAQHVWESFLEEGVPVDRLFRNPYGVSLEDFPDTSTPPGPPTVVHVGTWSYQKGCDLLVEAWQQLEGVRLLHVGFLGDVAVPIGPGFTHIDPVPQKMLTQYYGRAHVMALASRQEGLSLVQAQALASGLRLVCSKRTGGEDLATLLGVEDAIEVVPVDDVDALRLAITRALARVSLSAGAPRSLVPRENLELLSWQAYGKRYASEIRNRLR